MHYKQTLWTWFLLCKWNTQLQRFNMTLSASLCKSKWGAGLFVFALLRTTAERGWSGVQAKDVIKYTTELISLFNSKWLQEGPCLCAHTTAVSLWAHSGRREHMRRKDRALLDMSFKTPMLSQCSIFIHLWVSDRSLGQHIVSRTCQVSVGQDLCGI